MNASGQTYRMGLLFLLPSRLFIAVASLAIFAGVSTKAAGQCAGEQKLIASDAAAADLFGKSVSVNGDTALVGAWEDDHPGSGQDGSAYVYIRSGGVWVQQQKLIASDAAAGDHFGRSVSVSGDTALVGASLEDAGGNGAGSAYVFVRNGAVWTEQQKLTASDAGANDEFGASVAVDGNTAVVGAFFDVFVGPDQSAAYVYVRSGGVWTEQQKLRPADVVDGDEFGASVSVSGDTVVVGASEDDGAGGDSGSAYVFVRSGNVWTQQQKLSPVDAAASDRFGISVSVSGDTAVVGAYQDDSPGTDSGSVYVYVRSGSVWTLQQKLTAADPAVGDRFGVSVSVSGDKILVGAYFDNNPNTDSGSAYVFTRSGTVWTQESKLTPSDAAASDRFGNSVSVSGDTALVGAEVDSHAGGANAGSAYVFECLTPTGACCDDSTGDCSEDVTADECQVSGGRYGGDDSTCATINPPCEAPPEIAACCHDGQCENITQAQCILHDPSEWQAGELCGLGAQRCPQDACIDRTGSCFAQHSTPACDDSLCCSDVCFQDSFCCNVEWDQTCVGAAEAVCTPPPGDILYALMVDRLNFLDCFSQPCNMGIEVVDLNTMTMVRAFSLGVGAAMSLAVSPDGSKLFVADFSNNRIGAYDSNTGALLDSLPVAEPRDIVLSPDGSLLYISELQSIVIADSATLTIMDILSTGDNSPGAMSISPDGEYVGILSSSSPDNPAFYRLTTSTLGLSQLDLNDVAAGRLPNPSDVAFAGNDHAILWDNTYDDFYQVDVSNLVEETDKAVRFPGDAGGSFNFNNMIRFSPFSGKAYALKESGALCVMTPDPPSGFSVGGFDHIPFGLVLTPDTEKLLVSVIHRFNGGGADTLDNFDTITETFTRNVYTFTTANMSVRDMIILPATTAPPPPDPDPTGIQKGRTVSISFASPAVAGVTEMAIRVKLISLHHVVPPYTGGASVPFTSFEGQVRWVGSPVQYVESSSNPATFYASQLQCAPHYQDWSTVGLVHVLGSAIVPSSIYEVQNVAASCMGNEANCTAVSAPLTVGTTRWGDVTELFNPPSSTAQPDVADIAALVAKFRSLPTGPIKARALLAGDDSFGNINSLNVDFGFTHIAACVDAFRGKAYPHTIASCP